MSEIKFRAWDDEAKKWLLGYDIGKTGGFSLFGEIMVMGEWASILNEYLLHETHAPDALKVMQYIGLEDVNHKEIYEDDVVQVYYVHTSDISGMNIKSGDKSEQGRPILVRRDEDGTGFWPFVDGCGGCISYAMKAINHAKGYGNDEYGYYIVEVIGNKFQNPELLERKNA